MTVKIPRWLITAAVVLFLLWWGWPRVTRMWTNVPPLPPPTRTTVRVEAPGVEKTIREAAADLKAAVSRVGAEESRRAAPPTPVPVADPPLPDLSRMTPEERRAYEIWVLRK